MLLPCKLLLSQKENVGSDNTSTKKAIDSLNEMAFIVKRSDMVKALGHLSVSEGMATQIHYQKGLAVAYLYEAGIYQQSGYSNRALSIYYKALDISTSIADTFNIARCNQQIAGALKDNNNTEGAERLYRNSLQTFQRLDKQQEVANIYNSLGQLYLSQERFSEAMSYFDTARIKSILIHYDYGEKKSYQNIGQLFLRQKKLEDARLCFVKAREMDVHANDHYGMARSDIFLSIVAEGQGKNKDALAFGKSAYEMAKATKSDGLMQEAIEAIIKTYSDLNDRPNEADWQDTLVLVMKQQAAKDKQYAINFIDIIKDEETQKLTAQKKVIESNEYVKGQTIIIAASVAALIILSVVVVIALKNYKKQQLLGEELKDKNAIIEKNVLSLDELNQTISQKNETLEDENKLKDKLLSIISHDLRHPMVNTKSIIDLINMGMLTTEETKQLMVQLEGQYVKSITLLDNLLYWLRGQMEGRQAEKTQVNVHQLMSELIDEQKMNWQAKQITIENNIDAITSLMADKEMLKVIFRNLISNSIKFTSDNGIVHLTAIKQNNYVNISVRDNGIGMNTDTLQKVNARQYYSGTGTSKEKGTGFGLILCRDLVAKHNGELIIESEVNKGSNFIVRLPL
jgi:signal transduction histidine kinase/Tfp pilus assembly protein PilF